MVLATPEIYGTGEDYEKLSLRGNLSRQRNPYYAKLIDTQQEFTKKKQPFCFRCAKADWEELQNEKGKPNASRKELPTLDTYSDPNRFKFVKVDEARNPVRDVMNNKIVMTVVGKDYSYICKVRGCRHTIFKEAGEAEVPPIPMKEDLRKKQIF